MANRLEVLCKCRSHCTALNPTTNNYEGPGYPVSRSTRTRHVKDDILLNAQQTSPGVAAFEEQSTLNWLSQIEMEVDVLNHLAITSRSKPLVFSNNPRHHSFLLPGDNDFFRFNYGRHSLDSSTIANQQLLAVENRLCELQQSVTLVQGLEEASHLLDAIKLAMHRLWREKQVQWTEQRVMTDTGYLYINTEIHFQPLPLQGTQLAASLLSAVLESIYFVPRRALRTHLAGLRGVLRSSGASSSDITAIYKDPRSIRLHLNLQPVTRVYISCPSCHCIYPYQQTGNPGPESLPSCTYSRTPGGPRCGESLWKKQEPYAGRIYYTPRKKYYHQDIKAWVGRLLSRAGMEMILDGRPHIPPLDLNMGIDDIWLSEAILNLKDRNGAPFYPGPDGRCRLVFAFSFDGFNPFHMKTAKQSVSSTGMWLVLLNLPPHLRYLQENMWSSIIDGPEKPSLEEANHHFQLVVDELQEFWSPGVYFSRTSKHPNGRLCEAALVPVICDWLAARQVIGQASSPTAHYICTACDIDRDDIGVFDRKEWPTKNLLHIRHVAQLWKNALTNDEQDRIFDAYGIRWTPFLSLPYWNPTLYTVIDSMHTLDLNLFQNHVRELFKIDLKKKGGVGLGDEVSIRSKSKVASAKQRPAVKRCEKVVHDNPSDLLDQLLLFDRKILYTVCLEHGVIGEGHSMVIGTRSVLASNLRFWRQNPDYQNIFEGERTPEVSDDEDETELGPPEEVELDLDVDEFDPALKARIIRNVVSQGHENQTASRRKAYNQGTAALFRRLCDEVGILYADVEDNRRTTKQALFDKLIAFIDEGEENKTSLLSIIQVTTPLNRAVLGKDVMQAVWDDMKKSQMPTWINVAPHDWGTASRGKLSAAQWRVVCTIHLPITLIRLWQQDDGRKRDMLVHFMDLVTAVRIANMRVSSPQQVSAYNVHMGRYVSRLEELYPDENLKPTHHGAMHIGDFLKSMGPVHSHSAPFFERYINFFHRINHNQKFGQLESTFLHASARSANLRALLADNANVRRTVVEMVDTMDSVDMEDIRGFRLASILDPEVPTSTSRQKATLFPIDHHHFQLLRDRVGDHQSSREGLFFKEISIRGVCYSTAESTSPRNSAIAFRSMLARDQGPNLVPGMRSPRTGVIRSIFEYSFRRLDQDTKQIFMLVEERHPVNAAQDPYRRFGFAGGFLCSSQTTNLCLIGIEQVASHCVLTPMEEGLIHVLPVDRLMNVFDGVEDMESFADQE